ncbi:endolytic transglycosylase MltG [Alloscardovia macacae]|uniref:Endolytic murein transglycosylase n=1 Tax=Alloscardovia macacae TaxID=1160091 RepID=A0A261F1V0_9BIFI|nr:endolytic transglycosylase MltG [Alloscardovia macacae]OZG53045.1 YceG family protein [Alloscardovia macacae]
MTENDELFGMFDAEPQTGPQAEQLTDAQTTGSHQLAQAFAEHTAQGSQLDADIHADMRAQSSPAAPPLPPKRRRQVRAERKRRRRKKQMRVLIILIVLALMAGAGVGGYQVLRSLRHANVAAQTKESATLDYPGPGTPETVDFTIEEGEGVSSVAQKLVDAGVVRTAGAFTNAVDAANAAQRIQVGTFELKKQMAAADVVTIVTDPSKITGSLVVKSGEKMADVISAAVKLTGIAQSDFDALTNASTNGGATNILPAVAGGQFEGWFEPGTYNVKGMTSAADVLKAMVDKRVAKLQELGVPEDQYETVLIKSSIVEAEVNKDEYYGKVARVIENRLAQNIALGMDSTIAYGAGVIARDLTVSQLNDANNAYNTRIHTGLPPTPISNPGDKAIQAVMNPEAGDWIYFVTVNLDTGETKFTASQSEFEQYSKEYQDWEAAH